MSEKKRNPDLRLRENGGIERSGQNEGSGRQTKSADDLIRLSTHMILANAGSQGPVSDAAAPQKRWPYRWTAGRVGQA